jgi:hypothetical protein
MLVNLTPLFTQSKREQGNGFQWQVTLDDIYNGTEHLALPKHEFGQTSQDDEISTPDYGQSSIEVK